MSFSKYFEAIGYSQAIGYADPAIGYADPASSPDIIPYDLFLQTGFKIMQKALNKINGDVAIGFASARCFELLDDIMKTNAVGIVPSVKEDLARIKKKCYEELTIIGNLNAIEMINWTKKEIEVIIKTVIKKAGKGGGFILSDNHGEIPYQVPEQVLIDIKKAVEKYGTYS
ncbi:MAG: uroporphyrinogen decarboxylase family protein [Promethearchaeia archaeon]